MKLALVYQDVDPARGGAETYVADLCGALLRRGHEVTLYAEREAIGARGGLSGLEVRRVGPLGGRGVGRIWRFAEAVSQILLEEGFGFDCTIGSINTWGQDILIPQGGVRGASLAANSMRFRAGLPRWLYCAGKRINPKWWVYAEIERRQYDPARGSRIVAVSEMVRGHLERYHGVSPDRVRVIPNAIDAGRLEVADREVVRREFRERIGVSDDDVVALFTGHNFRLKGLASLIRAMAAQRGARRSARLHALVCGSGDAGAFERLARQLGVEARVHFAGFVPDVRAAYHASDALVLPTYYDPCSLVVFEGLACGLPVVTTRCNGAGELIEPGVQGYVVDDPEDIGALAAALDALLEPARRARMSEAARRLGETLTFDRHVDRLLALAQEVAARRRASHGAGELSEPHGLRRKRWFRHASRGEMGGARSAD